MNVTKVEKYAIYYIEKNAYGNIAFLKLNYRTVIFK